MIFRGTGEIIALAEKAQYDSDVFVIYQRNGWQYRETQMKYVEECLQPYMKKKREDWQNYHVGKLQEGAVCDDCAEEEAPYGIMVQDNLKSQCLEEFVSFVEEHCHMVVHMGEKDESTHMWAAIDRGIGKQIKTLVETEQCAWLMMSRDNVSEWNSQRMSCSRRSILMTQWVGAAWRKYCQKYQKFHDKCCKRSGLLVALDDHDIDEIRLEGVPNWRAEPTVKLDEHFRAYYKDLVKSHVVPKKVDAELFCLCLCMYVIV